MVELGRWSQANGLDFGCFNVKSMKMNFQNEHINSKTSLRVNVIGLGNLIKATSLIMRMDPQLGLTVYCVDLTSTRVGSSAAVKRTLLEPKKMLKKMALSAHSNSQKYMQL
jgi:hypothetical protein